MIFKGLKLQRKILLVLTGTSLVPLIVCGLIMAQLTQRTIRKDMAKVADNTENSVVGTLADSRIEQSNYISLLSSSNDLVNAAYYASLTGDAEQSADLITRARNNYDFDVLELLADDGATRFRAARKNLNISTGLPADHAIIGRSRDGNLESRIDVYDGRLSLMVIAPVLLQEEPVGHLLGVTFLDDGFARQIRNASGAEVGFFMDGKIVSASTPELAALPLTNLSETGTGNVELHDAPHTLFTRKLTDRGHGILLAVDRTAEIAATRSITIVLFTVLAVSALVAVLVGLAFSRRLVQPLQTVVANLKEIADGEADLTHSLPVNSSDEVGELASSFNRFMKRLRAIVTRSQEVTRDLFSATEKVGSSSREVNQGANIQARSLEESYLAIEEIDEANRAVAHNINDLMTSAEESSSATLQLGATASEVAELMERLFNNVDEVSSSINEMTVSSQQVADNISVLSSSTEATASSITELDSSIRAIEENAEQTMDLSEEASQDAESGKKVVDETIRGFESVRETVNRATAAIVDLGRQSDQIGRILTVIDEVADQTGLLSLNAAIIAAQAGDKGRSFAVVADEIRELAHRTAVSTREIATIIENLQNGTREAVGAMRQGSEQVHREAERSRTAGDALEKIRTSTMNAMEQVRAIVRSTREQANGSRQITAAINQVTEMLSQIETAAGQQTESTRQLSRTAESMHEIAAHVKRSTTEQKMGGSQIARNLERIRQMVTEINSSTTAQTEKSRQVVEAVSRVRDIAELNTARTAELDQVSESLGELAAALDKEMGAFRS